MMHRMLVLLATLAWAAPAAAQITYEGCRDMYGMPVASIMNAGINDVAIATVQSGRPVIFYNPNVLMQLPPIVRRFFYAHECGHHRLGHLLRGPASVHMEQEADCWGAHALRAQGVSPAEFNVIAQAMSRLGPGDWTHLPGPNRAINLGRCLSQPAPRPPALGRMCCDAAGHPRCGLSAPLPAGGPCVCPGQGQGRVCPPRPGF